MIGLVTGKQQRAEQAARSLLRRQEALIRKELRRLGARRLDDAGRGLGQLRERKRPSIDGR